MATRAVSLWCADCVEIGMAINLWDRPGGMADGATVVARGRHGEPCTLTDSRSVGGREFVRVDCESGSGWLTDTLVQAR